jgi:hypothetical protein
MLTARTPFSPKKFGVFLGQVPRTPEGFLDTFPSSQTTLQENTMVLKRPELCRVTGFNSWTDIELWIRDIVAPAYHELVEDYLKAFKDRGEKDPGGNGAIKEYFVRFAYDIEKLVTKRAAEMQSGHSGQEQEINKERCT